MDQAMRSIASYDERRAAGIQHCTSAMRMAQERQMMEDTSPRDQYNRSVKEANAAYAEAVRECSRMA